MEPNQEPPINAQFTQCSLCQTGSYPYFGYVGKGVCNHCGTEWTYDEGDRPTEESLQRLWSKMPRWIPVSERLPEDDQQCLTVDKHGVPRVARFDAIGDGERHSWYEEQEWKSVHPVAWMPLPEPPAA